MKALILGGGFAGCSLAYFLRKKGHKATIIEKGELGGLCRTYYYGGHPYEFGPHVFMSKDHPSDPTTVAFMELTNGKYRRVDRQLLSYVEEDNKFYRYPVHYDDIKKMPDKDIIYDELKKIRLEDGTLVNPPRRGKDTSFAKYYIGRLGERLYNKLMKAYTHKMWGYPGEDMPTDTTFADQLRDKNQDKDVDAHDPMHFEHTPLAANTFCVYPEGGFNPMFDRMVEGCDVRREEVIVVTKGSIITNGESIWPSEYDVIFNTLAPDMIRDRITKLRAMGRILIPFMLSDRVMETIETIYYPGLEFQTRLTNMDRVTGYHQKDWHTLITLEIPVYPQKDMNTVFPRMKHLLKTKDSVYCARAYPDRREDQIQELMHYREGFPENTVHCGRMAEWQYMGMSEVMRSAYDKVEEL